MKNILIFMAMILGLASCEKRMSRTPPLASSMVVQRDTVLTRWAALARMLRDPSTKEVPWKVIEEERVLNQTIYRANIGLKIRPIGPTNIGGRTRAVQIDRRNEDVIMAAAVGGGIWKSINGGNSWLLKTNILHNSSFTTIIQDPRSGKGDMWYAGGGEGGRNATGSYGLGAIYTGSGVCRSVDNGETWHRLPSTGNVTNKDFSNWRNVYKLAARVDSLDGLQIFAATNGKLMKSIDEGLTWSVEYSNFTNWIDADLAISENNTLYFVVNQNSNPSHGLYKSTDGKTWSQVQAILNGFFTDGGIKMVNDLSRDNGLFIYGPFQNSFRAYAYNGNTDQIDLVMNGNLPNGPKFSNTLGSQGGYNLCLAMSSWDTNTLFAGGVNLFRSTDKFQSNSKIRLIGGSDTMANGDYADLYPGHHPDNHGIIFFPSNPKKAISFHDGGMSKTENIFDSIVNWQLINSGYQTSLLYDLSLKSNSNGALLIGGTQDNGFISSLGSDTWDLVELGDGACSIFGADGALYATTTARPLKKIWLNQDGALQNSITISPQWSYGWFNNFELDLKSKNTAFLSANDKIYKRDSLSSIDSLSGNQAASSKWDMLYALQSGERATYLKSGVENGQSFLICGTTSRILRIDSIWSTPVATNISSTLPVGDNISDIEVGVSNPNELVVVYPNYNAYSIIRSVDGGQNWEGIAGNLEIMGANSSVNYVGPGPSVRCFKACYYGGSRHYFVGTSSGLFYTDSLQGDNTAWAKVGGGGIDNSVVVDLEYDSTGLLYIATHGRGVFKSDLSNFDLVDDSTGFYLGHSKPDVDFDVSVFPNPAGDFITISFEQVPTQVDYTVTNLNGKVLLNGKMNGQKEKTLMLDLAHGMYLINIEEDSGGMTVIPFVKL